MGELCINIGTTRLAFELHAQYVAQALASSTKKERFRWQAGNQSMTSTELAEGAHRALNISPTFWDWALLAGLVPLICITVDAWANRHMMPPSPRKAITLSLMWIGVSLAACGVVFMRFGGTAASQYLSAYVAEKSLSFDNVFAWSVIFSQFRLYRGYHARLMMSGVLMTIVLRLVMMFAFVTALTQFWWVELMLVAFLFYLAAKLIFATEEEENPESDPTKKPSYQRMLRLLPVAEDTYGTGYLTRQAGRGVVRVGPLKLGRLRIIRRPIQVMTLPFKLTFFALVAVYFFITNTGFSFDSLPVVLAVSSSTFIIVTSNIQSLLGLTSLYFLYDALSDKFWKLGKVLPYVLVFMGVKGLLGLNYRHFGLKFEGWEINSWFSLAIIFGIIGAGVAWSIKVPPARAEQREPVTLDRDLDPVAVA